MVHVTAKVLDNFDMHYSSDLPIYVCSKALTCIRYSSHDATAKHFIAQVRDSSRKKSSGGEN